MENQMTEQENKVLNGYVTASTEITKGITESFAAGASIDEILAALKVQAEVMAIRLAQAVMHQQQVEAMKAHQVAEAQAAGESELNVEDESNDD
jgi:ActR/RegA family two-component response regulator